MSPLLRIPVALVAVVLKLLAPIALWFACMAVVWFAVEFGSMERYSPEDKIHPAFQILVQDEHGIRPMRLEKWQGGQVLVRQETEYRDEDGSGHRLRRIAPDTYELFADLDTAMMTQTYRITPDNRVVPLSFRWRNIADVVLVFPLSLVFWLCTKWMFGMIRRKRPKKNQAAGSLSNPD